MGIGSLRFQIYLILKSSLLLHLNIVFRQIIVAGWNFVYFCFEKEEETKKEERKKKEKENRKWTEREGNEKSWEGCANIHSIKYYGVQVGPGVPAPLVVKRKSIKTDPDYQKQIDRSLVILLNTKQIHPVFITRL